MAGILKGPGFENIFIRRKQNDPADHPPDLDIICIRPMDPFLKHGALLAPTKPVGLSNDLMMARPGHPLFLEFIDNLENAYNTWQRFFIIRHLRVMMTTGSLFVTMTWKNFTHRRSSSSQQRSLQLPGQRKSICSSYTREHMGRLGYAHAFIHQQAPEKDPPFIVRPFKPFDLLVTGIIL